MMSSSDASRIRPRTTLEEDEQPTRLLNGRFAKRAKLSGSIKKSTPASASVDKATAIATSESSVLTSASPTSSAASSSSLKATAPSSAVAVVTIPPNSIGLRYLPDFLTAVECEKLIASAEKTGFQRSTVASGGETVYHESTVRTSSNARIGYSHPTVVSILDRAAQLTQFDTSHLSIGLVKYEPGQLYKPHHDTDAVERNPRRYTVLVYLNDVEGEGGETDFPRLNIRVKPRRGAALFWENMDAKKVLRQDSLHQGLPPKTGVKYVFNLWCHFGPPPFE